MSDVVQTYNTYAPASTPEATPVIVPTVGGGKWRVTRVEIVIPAGHVGLTGIQLWYGGGPALPYDSGWFSGDNDVIRTSLSDIYPQGVGWSVAMLNNDAIQHGWQTRWFLTYVTASSNLPSAPPLTAADIYNASLQTVG